MQTQAVNQQNSEVKEMVMHTVCATQQTFLIGSSSKNEVFHWS